MNKDTNETKQNAVPETAVYNVNTINNEQAESILSKAIPIVASIIRVQGSEFKIQNLESLIKSTASAVANVHSMMFGTGKAPIDIENSVTEDYIVCLENGAKVKMLRKYIRQFGMSEEDYRRKWSLPPSYPFVAPSYSKRRRELAYKAKLGYMRQIKNEELKKKAA